MSDLKLDRVTGDLVFENGDLVLTQGQDALEQRILLSLMFFLGDAFESPAEGIPYFDRVLVKNPPIPALTTIFRRAILLVDGVDEIERFQLNYDPQQRSIRIDFRVRGVLGEVVTIKDFIIDG